ncbi:short-chain dehydrogenase/reductase SDR [Stachybotrys elegans]|uniref:Short-chain dehydrogenase/reductase SDR n=1 Tax=Stachybotrys elegans TaxID=80388 RepID=A0A8K0WZ57_9HYPO|nr:short-chain dehydrogenase/reductase SDR [Stachybotrys elegans]
MPSDGAAFATYPSLIDRIVVISGGATGIGASFVEHFALQGSQVIFLDILDEAADTLISTLAGLGVKHVPIFHHCDLTDIDGQLRPTAATILAAYPRVSVVINNAARDERRPTLDITADEWDHDMSTNLRHVFFLTQALMPGLLAAGGAASVINMGSIAWSIPSTGLVPYVASKSAIVGLTKTLAKEFGPRGVRVNSIMPGAIATERQQREILTPEYEAHVRERQSLAGMMKPEQVARMALWLAADDSSGVTQQSFVVDAGWI